MKDLNERNYATTAIKAGDIVQVDGDFTCLNDGETRTVVDDGDGPKIACTDGWHYLDGQLSDDGSHYVGVYPTKGADHAG